MAKSWRRRHPVKRVQYSWRGYWDNLDSGLASIVTGVTGSTTANYDILNEAEVLELGGNVKVERVVGDYFFQVNGTEGDLNHWTLMLTMFKYETQMGLATWEIAVAQDAFELPWRWMRCIRGRSLTNINQTAEASNLFANDRAQPSRTRDGETMMHAHFDVPLKERVIDGQAVAFQAWFWAGNLYTFNASLNCRILCAH